MEKKENPQEEKKENLPEEKKENPQEEKKENSKEEKKEGVEKGEKIKPQIFKSATTVESAPKKELSLLASQAEVKKLLTSKIQEYKKHANFILAYSKGFLSIITKFHEILYNSIYSNLQSNMNLINYLRGFTTTLREAEEGFLRLQIHFKPAVKKNVKPGIDQKTKLTEEAHKSLCTGLVNYQKSLDTKIFSKGPIREAEGVLTKIDAMKKEGIKRIGKLERRRKKFEKLWKSKFETLFLKLIPFGTNELIKPNPNNNNFEDFDDFMMIDRELYERMNKLLLKNSVFLTDIKEAFAKTYQLIKDFNKLIRDSLEIFVAESKHLLNVEILKPFFALEGFIQEVNQKIANSSSTNFFKIKDFFRDEVDIKIINEALKDYQPIIKESEENIAKEDNNFDITKFEDVKAFFENLIAMNPKPFNNSSEDFELKNWDVRRDPGIFSSWKNCTLFITKQNHILILDNKNEKKSDIIFELGRIKFGKKADKKLKHLFELDAFKKGKQMNFTGRYSFDAIKEEELLEIEKYISCAVLVSK